MFTDNVFFLSTSIIRERGRFAWRSSGGLLAARKVGDGLLMKDVRGNDLKVRTGKAGADKHLILNHTQQVFGARTTRMVRLDDAVLTERIIAYLREYYGKCRTNCATFAEYLRTGNFCECHPDKLGLMFLGSMNRYTGQKVRPGDSLCILYYSAWGRSRRVSSAMRNQCRKNGGDPTSDLRKLKGGRDYTLSPEQLLEQYRSAVFADFHFMFCIGTHDGEPVFIQQMGLKDPEDTENLNPIIVSIGMNDLRNDGAPPAYLFIKRGRK